MFFIILPKSTQRRAVPTVVEISDSTLGFDLTTKSELYAGLYRSVTAYAEQETVVPLAAPLNGFPVAEAF